MTEPRLDELIERCRDDDATDGDRAELERRLRDPAALRAFVAAQRLDAELAALLGDEIQLERAQAVLLTSRAAPPSRLRRPAWHGWTAVAAALFVACVALWWIVRPPVTPPPREALAHHTAPVPTAPAGGDGMSPELAVSVFGLATANAVK